MINVLAAIALLLLVGSVVAGVLTYRIAKHEHEIGRYELTWAVGIGVLFLMGIGPALVGIGLYLTVELGYPLYWLYALAVAGFLAMLGLGLAVSTIEVVAVEYTEVS